MVAVKTFIPLLVLTLGDFAAAHNGHGRQGWFGWRGQKGRPHGYVTQNAGCGKQLSAGIKQGGTGDSNNITITSGGVKRSFLLHVPTNYDPSTATGLIFSFHGRGGDSSTQEGLSQFSNERFNPDKLAVYPQGIKNEWQGDPDATTNDVQFTMDMISKLESDYCIDQNKIFAAGKSNGGGFSINILACDPQASQKIAAFASASGAYYQHNKTNVCKPETIAIACNPGRDKIPIFETHGGIDDTIPYAGGPRRGECLPSVPHFITAWAARDGLVTSNYSTSLYNGHVTEYQFGKHDYLRGIVTSYFVPSMDHVWPSTVVNSDSIAHDVPPTYFNATPLMVDFFNKWTLDWDA